MVPLRLEKQAEVIPDQKLPQHALTYLNYLRFISMSCRTKRKTNLFEACALLHVERHASREAYAEALMRCLGEALGKPAKLYAPSTDEMTFDENWLVQIGLASARGDHASTDFLLKSRVAPEHQRSVRFLVAQIAKQFSLEPHN